MQPVGGIVSTGQCGKGREDLGFGEKEPSSLWQQAWWPITLSCTQLHTHAPSLGVLSD